MTTTPMMHRRALAASLLFVLVSKTQADISRRPNWQAPGPEDLVAVTELTASSRTDGCGAISIFDLRSGTPVYNGPNDPSLHRIAADPTLDLIIAAPGVGNRRFVQRLRRHEHESDVWHYDRVQTRYNLFNSYSGVAVLSDPPRLVLNISLGGEGIGHIASVSSPTSDNYDFHKDEFVTRLETRRNVPVIINEPNAHRIVGLSSAGDVFTADSADLTPLHEPLAMPTIVYSERDTSSPDRFVQATLSPGGRYLVANQYEEPFLMVLDRVTEQKARVDVSAWMTMTGGVAFNAGWQNTGLLAVHGGSRVVIFEFNPTGKLKYLSSARVVAPMRDDAPLAGQVQWSGDGTHVIAATNNGSNEFAVLRVSECGSNVVQVLELEACQDPLNLPGDIVSANGFLNPPSNWEPSCTLPDWMSDPTPEFPRASPIATNTPTAAHYIAVPVSIKP